MKHETMHFYGHVETTENSAPTYLPQSETVNATADADAVERANNARTRDIEKEYYNLNGTKSVKVHGTKSVNVENVHYSRKDNTILATIESWQGEDDTIAQLLASASETARDIVMAVCNTDIVLIEKRREVCALADSLSTEEMAKYLSENFDAVMDTSISADSLGVLNGNFYAVAVFMLYCGRMVMGKLKGKYQRHADNAFIRARRARFQRAWLAYRDNGFIWDFFNSDVIREAVKDAKNTALEMVRLGLENEGVDAPAKMARGFCEIINDYVDILASPYFEIAQAFSASAKTTFDYSEIMASDIELLHECIIALLDVFRNYGVTDFETARTFTREYFANWYDKLTENVSVKNEDVSPRTLAYRQLDNFMGQYKSASDISTTKDIESTFTGTLERGLHNLTAEEETLYNGVIEKIRTSARFKDDDARDEAKAVLYMRLRGFGYDVIARVRGLTKRNVRTILKNVGLIIASMETFEERVTIETNSKREKTAVVVTYKSALVDNSMRVSSSRFAEVERAIFDAKRREEEERRARLEERRARYEDAVNNSIMAKA